MPQTISKSVTPLSLPQKRSLEGKEREKYKDCSWREREREGERETYGIKKNDAKERETEK